MRDIKFSFSISQGYGDKLFEVSRVIARTIATDSFDERQAMLIGVIEQLAHGAPVTGPQPVVQEPTALRAVS